MIKDTCLKLNATFKTNSIETYILRQATFLYNWKHFSLSIRMSDHHLYLNMLFSLPNPDPKALYLSPVQLYSCYPTSAQ